MATTPTTKKKNDGDDELELDKEQTDAEKAAEAGKSEAEKAHDKAEKARDKDAKLNKDEKPLKKRAPRDGAPVRVKATQMGYYGDERRRPGSVFDITPDQFSDRWMEKVPENTPITRPKGAQEALEDQRKQHLQDVAASKRGAETRPATGSASVI